MHYHYNDVIMTTIASQITSLMVVYSTVYSDADQRKHKSSASLAFVWGIHRDRWIPRTKGQLRGKCFHLMTSSWLLHSWCSHDFVNTLKPGQNGRYFPEWKHSNFHWNLFPMVQLTHWGRVTHICVTELTIIGSDNGLSPDRRQAIIWTNAGLLLIGPLGTNFSEILIEIITFSFKKMRLKVSSAKRWPFCLGLNVLTINQHWFK